MQFIWKFKIIISMVRMYNAMQWNATEKYITYTSYLGLEWPEQDRNANEWCSYFHFTFYRIQKRKIEIAFWIISNVWIYNWSSASKQFVRLLSITSKLPNGLNEFFACQKVF